VVRTLVSAGHWHDTRLDALEDKLERILAVMERGTRAPAPPPPRHRTPETVHNDNPGDDEEQSSNPEFRELLKFTFQYIQTTHHYENWTDVPARISNSIDTIVKNIRPPMPATEVHHQLTKAGDEFKSAITAAVQGHLHSCATATKDKLSKTNMADFDMAATRAKKRYGRRLGTRARQDTADRAIDKLTREGVKQPARWELPRKPAKMAKLAPATHVEHNNRFAALDGILEGNPDLESGPEGETSEQRGPFRIPTAPLPQRTPLRLKRRAEGSPQQGGAQLEQQTAMDVLPDEPTGDTEVDSDGEVESIADSPPAARAKQSPLAVKWAAAKSRPSYYKVVEGKSADKSTWRIREDVTGNDIRTLIMADSNGAAFTGLQLPDDVQTYAFRGARLNDIRRVLEEAGPLPSVRTVVIAAGINDRDSDPSDVVAVLRHLKTWGERADKLLLFTGIPTFHTLKPAAQRAVTHINRTAEDLFGGCYVEPVAEEQVDIIDEQSWGIHYSSATAGHVYASVKPLLN